MGMAVMAVVVSYQFRFSIITPMEGDDDKIINLKTVSFILFKRLNVSLETFSVSLENRTLFLGSPHSLPAKRKILSFILDIIFPSSLHPKSIEINIWLWYALDSTQIFNMWIIVMNV